MQHGNRLSMVRNENAGDMDGAATWRKIIKAIEVMQATEPDGTTH